MKRLLVTLAAAGLVALTLQGCAGLVVGGGAAAGVVISQDRRTFGTMIDDQTIEYKAATAISEDAQLAEQAHINITSYNGIVLLTGEAPADTLKKRAYELVKGIEKVRRVHNEIAIAGPSSGLSRSNDVVLGTKVRTALLGIEGLENFSPTFHVKVVTERATVYLMGLLSHAEADAVTDATRRVSGVERVVKIFEYQD